MSEKNYQAPEMDVKEQAQFENVFTYCNKGNAHAQGCVNITGTGNSADQVINYEEFSAAFSGGGTGGGSGL
ncbi:MAG: hypothetical protein FWE14_03000 [Lachnospiraceae bacterium]|nr:hypothetical protein [Lachnospiraceae bacterium]